MLCKKKMEKGIIKFYLLKKIYKPEITPLIFWDTVFQWPVKNTHTRCLNKERRQRYGKEMTFTTTQDSCPSEGCMSEAELQEDFHLQRQQSRKMTNYISSVKLTGLRWRLQIEHLMWTLVFLSFFLVFN